jgi:hypothetical protein
MFISLRSFLTYLSLTTFCLAQKHLSPQVEQGGLPLRVHVFEDFETTIEKRWWLRGSEVTGSKDLPKSFSDIQTKMYEAVIFNPVPGPPMAGNTRLSFRYFLTRTSTLKCQIYSLSNGYHRHLILKDLPQEKWQSVTVDMTQARRPDGSGGPLSKDERIDDIQFYVNPGEEVLIDDIVLYEPSPTPKSEQRPFPKRMLFTGWFDTGKQGPGHEWPGEFDIVLHQKPKTWDAAQSVKLKETGKNGIIVNMRGMRPLSQLNRLKFQCKLVGAEKIQVLIRNSQTQQTWEGGTLTSNSTDWTEQFLDFKVDKEKQFADEIHFLMSSARGTLHVDDLLLYEPGE